MGVVAGKTQGGRSGQVARAVVVLPYGNGEIAEMLGVSRNSVTASVSRLQSQGVVEKRRNSMRVVDLDKLREIAYMERE